MKLTHALRLNSTPRVAIVGGGGKTTTMFTLAREYPSPVIVAATAHMAIAQLEMADRHIFVNAPAELDGFQLQSGVTFFSGRENSTAKTMGLTVESTRAVLALAEANAAPLYIEADGSKCLPLKAPAEHEPPIPDFVDTVIYVVGLAGLGKPLNDEAVHRPDRYARLSGLAIGEAVTPDAVASVLRSPLGGLKNIPATARRIAVLNQADTPELQAQAQIIARQLLPAYQTVIISALKFQQIFAVHEATAGVILAAGASTRMGQPKPLLIWRGEPFIRHVARTALAAGLSPVVIVTGAHDSAIRAAVSDLPVQVIHNAEWAAGQSTSVRAGLNVLPPDIGSAMFLLADQPHIPIELVKTLIDQHAQALAPIVAPLIEDRRGNPVLFDRSTFDALSSLSGDVGGRAVFSKHPVTYVPWHDARLLLDVDTPEDYQRLKTLEGRSV
ncbi:MAG: putative selenium-dependent hydroxylase accessory protein YqeC [Chloroflexi bacterium]|nr:putative selenium-dependent hydroxylase accessory protein YqeC [Chloroflexota bacterium]